jgi:hypothetical protein
MTPPPAASTRTPMVGTEWTPGGGGDRPALVAQDLGAGAVLHRAPLDLGKVPPAGVEGFQHPPRLPQRRLDADDWNGPLAPQQPDPLHEEREPARVVGMLVRHDQRLHAFGIDPGGERALHHVRPAVDQHHAPGVLHREHGGGAARVARGGPGSQQVHDGHGKLRLVARKGGTEVLSAES